MKNLFVISLLLMSAACAPAYNVEADRAAHEQYLERVYNLDNAEYMSGCLYYEEFVCEFK